MLPGIILYLTLALYRLEILSESQIIKILIVDVFIRPKVLLRVSVVVKAVTLNLKFYSAAMVTLKAVCMTSLHL